MLRRLLHLDLDKITDSLERRQAPLVQRVLLGSLAPGIVTLPAAIMLTYSTPYYLYVWAVILLLISLSFGALVVLRRGHVRAAVLIGSIAIALTMHSFVIMEGLSSGAAPVIGFVLPVALVGLFAGRRMLVSMYGLIILGLVAMAGLANISPAWVGFAPLKGDQTDRLITGVVLIVGVLAVLLDQYGGTLREALGEAEANQRAAEAAQARAQQQAQALAEQTAQLERTEQYLRELVATLEAPAVQLADGILLTPIVGALDSQRVHLLTTRLLDQVSKQRVRRIVIDIGGVPVVDTGVALALQRMVTALKLLGCEVTLTGISAAIAGTIAGLGIVFAGVTIARSPQDVLEMKAV